ncbi:MAG TPA: hypothetical protein VIA18_26630 [Polyangia bacterium]|jgi:hypothetical protein|nr:hypothetical protein [Polyangia bacterium]HWE27405.1 hypothetical protein [Polyangia bacterium]
MMASLGHAAGYRRLADEHYDELVRALIDDRHEVVWSGAQPQKLTPRPPADPILWA